MVGRYLIDNAACKCGRDRGATARRGIKDDSFKDVTRLLD